MMSKIIGGAAHVGGASCIAIQSLAVAFLAGCPPTPSVQESAPSVSVTGCLERLDSPTGSVWVGEEMVAIADDLGSCVRVRKVEGNASSAACPGCEIRLDQVDSWVAAQIDECYVDLGELPTLRRSLGFVLEDPTAGSGSGELVVRHGESWLPYSIGTLEAGVLTWHHQAQIGGGDPWSFDPDRDIRDLPVAPVDFP